jgi:hypothetical protein
LHKTLIHTHAQFKKAEDLLNNVDEKVMKTVMPGKKEEAGEKSK